MVVLVLAYVAYSDECSSHLMVSTSRDRRPSSPFGGLVVSHVRKWFSVCRTPHAQSSESVIFHLCSVSIVRPIPVRARLSCTQHRRGSDAPLHLPASGRNARSLYCCCFAIRSATCPSAISSQGVFLRRRGVEFLPVLGMDWSTFTWSPMSSWTHQLKRPQRTKGPASRHHSGNKECHQDQGTTPTAPRPFRDGHQLMSNVMTESFNLAMVVSINWQGTLLLEGLGEKLLEQNGNGYWGLHSLTEC